MKVDRISTLSHNLAILRGSEPMHHPSTHLSMIIFRISLFTTLRMVMVQCWDKDDNFFNIELCDISIIILITVCPKENDTFDFPHVSFIFVLGAVIAFIFSLR